MARCGGVVVRDTMTDIIGVVLSIICMIVGAILSAIPIVLGGLILYWLLW